jgi:hypothetical protein
MYLGSFVVGEAGFESKFGLEALSSQEAVECLRGQFVVVCGGFAVGFGHV